MDDKQVNLDELDLVDAEVDIVDKSEDEVEPACRFTTGIAGSGKTFGVRKQIEDDPSSGLLTATTGIAAVNLGSITLHSALGLLPDSIADDYQSGKLKRKLHPIALKHRELCIDECSMLGGRELLDILYLAIKEVNGYADVKQPLGIHLIGDFCQLPPINASWCFEAECWDKFERGTTKLTKNWRQAEGAFLDALNHLRAGDGMAGAGTLARISHFDRAADPTFDGTTIVGTNDEVSRYNNLHYLKLQGTRVTYTCYRERKQRAEWTKNIPDQLDLKDAALVMVLTNDTAKDPVTKEPLFRWVNGDLGHVTQLLPSSVDVKLLRTGTIERIHYIERENGTKSAPDEYDDAQVAEARKQRQPLPDGTYWDSEKRLWIRGRIRYMPLRLAYATTVHKSQGLSLDRVQVDLRHNFVGKPSMVYVALSRARTAEGLRLVGNPELLARRCNVDPKVQRWL